jgi:small GTP-binding protein
MQDQLQKLLENLMGQLNGVEMLSVMDSDGLPIVSKIRSGQEDVVGALTASLDNYISRIKKDYKGDSFENITIIGNKQFYFSSIPGIGILIIIANQNITDNQLKVYGQWAVNKLNCIFQKQDVNLTVPKILSVLSKFAGGKFPAGQFSTKVIVCGDYKVGKTSLIRRFVDNSFAENYIATIGVDITKKEIKIQDDCTIDFIIWDIGGQIQQMAPYRKRFYNGANAALIVFDKTRKDSFDHIQIWLDDISRELGNERIPKILVGNKSDLTQDIQVSSEELKQLAEKLNLEFIETSAKTSENVEEAFKYIAYKVVI